MGDNSIRQLLESVKGMDEAEVRCRLEAGEPLYPHSDVSVKMRTCDQEVLHLIRGTISGKIPSWLKGSLLRNGAGKTKFGNTTYQHMFDGPALLHRFAIEDGQVSYRCSFLKSATFLKNLAANRIVVDEFGTRAAPDPCKTIFHALSTSYETEGTTTDNANVSVYPFQDEFYCFTETPFIHRIDPSSLDTIKRVDVSKHVAIVNHTSHPHVDFDGSVYNQALRVHHTGPQYCIVKFPSDNGKASDMFERAEVVASVEAHRPLNPSYAHTFGLTDRFYVMVEQPLTISVADRAKAEEQGRAMASLLKFFKDDRTRIHVLERSSGKLHRTYVAEAFCYFHIVNQFESGDHLAIDICCYSDGDMINCLYFDAIKDMQKNPDYARLMRSRPLRFVLPLAPLAAEDGTNLVTLAGSGAAAWWQDGQVMLSPEPLCDLGCEMPRINYDKHLGKPYRYFYAISTDVDLPSPTMLIKVDTETKTAKTWSEKNVFPSEPVFVPSPNPKAEDDGVLLSALVWGGDLDTQVALLVVDASSMTELGRAVFKTPSPVPSTLHGWFTHIF